MNITYNPDFTPDKFNPRSFIVETAIKALAMGFVAYIVFEFLMRLSNG